MEDTLKQSNRKGSRVQKNTTAAEKLDQENQASKPQTKKSSKTENNGEQEKGTVISNKSGARKTAKVNGVSESNEAPRAENGKAEEEMIKIKQEEDTEINEQRGKDRHVDESEAKGEINAKEKIQPETQRKNSHEDSSGIVPVKKRGRPKKGKENPEVNGQGDKVNTGLDGVANTDPGRGMHTGPDKDVNTVQDNDGNNVLDQDVNLDPDKDVNTNPDKDVNTNPDKDRDTRMDKNEHAQLDKNVKKKSRKGDGKVHNKSQETVTEETRVSEEPTMAEEGEKTDHKPVGAEDNEGKSNKATKRRNEQPKAVMADHSNLDSEYQSNENDDCTSPVKRKRGKLVEVKSEAEGGKEIKEKIHTETQKQSNKKDSSETAQDSSETAHAKKRGRPKKDQKNVEINTSLDKDVHSGLAKDANTNLDKDINTDLDKNVNSVGSKSQETATANIKSEETETADINISEGSKTVPTSKRGRPPKGQKNTEVNGHGDKNINTGLDKDVQKRPTQKSEVQSKSQEKVSEDTTVSEAQTSKNKKGGKRDDKVDAEDNQTKSARATKRQNEQPKAVMADHSNLDSESQSNENDNCTSPVKRKRGKQVEVKSEAERGKETKKKIHTETQKQNKEDSPETAHAKKRGRPKKGEEKTKSSPKKFEETRDPKSDGEDATKRKRGRQEHTVPGDEEKPTDKKGKGKHTSDKSHATSKWEENAAKFKWAKSAKKKFVGGHVSIAGGLYKAVLEAEDMGSRAFGLFLRSQRQWATKPLADKDAQKFRDTCVEYGYHPDMILPHGSYLMNCGSPEEENLQKSRNLLVEELQRCQKLGLTRFNFHPGSTCGKISVEECLDRIGDSINQALDKTEGVTVVIENMCCQGNTVGGKFEELREIINRVQDKTRIGVCLDTCHMFAAGYDISTEKGFSSMMEEFERVVGLRYLKAIHLNDSKGEVGNNLDRHENIGKGHIGMEGFRRIMNDSRLNNIPMILETPCPDDDTYEKEVKILYSLCK
nr:transcriptional regulator ATRX isoform X1 [Crassostrea gigas]